MLVRHSEAKMVANGYVVNPSIIVNVGFCKCGALLRHGVLIVVVDVAVQALALEQGLMALCKGTWLGNRTFYGERMMCVNATIRSSAISLYCLISPRS